MVRDFQINGETLALVKGGASSEIAALSELGLAEGPITVTPAFRHKPINVDAWGEAPAEIQFMLAWVNIAIPLIHVDLAVLDVCERESMGGAAAIGRLSRAGSRLGNNVARFANGWHYISLNLTSPVLGKPWRFYNCYLIDPPVQIPLGTTKSVYMTNWQAIPYTQDPYQGGLGAQGQILWDHVLDN